VKSEKLIVNNKKKNHATEREGTEKVPSEIMV
jgi:hypothetical protein